MEEVIELSAVAREAAEWQRRAEEAGINLRSCYQCGKCTAGCPVAFAMDYGPRQIVRFLQLGLWRQALSAHSIWLCAACDTCSTRCPRQVDPARMMDWLRVEAGRRGMVKEPHIKLFNDSFLQLVERYGRVHELELILRFNMRSGQPFKDARMGPELLKRRKLHLLPRRIKGVKVMRRIFAHAQKAGGEGD